MNLIQSIQKNAIGLGLFAVVTVGAIALTQHLTLEKIKLNEKAYQARLLLDILPDSDESLAQNPINLSELPLTKPELLNVSNDDVYYIDPISKNIILPLVAPDGYTEAIRLLVGIKPDGSIAAVRVVSHKETPGLGDRIAVKKSPWILQFNNKSLTYPTVDLWTVKKDQGAFDQLTGATISPKAVVRAVRRSLEFYQLNQHLLLEPDA